MYDITSKLGSFCNTASGLKSHALQWQHYGLQAFLTCHRWLSAELRLSGSTDSSPGGIQMQNNALLKIITPLFSSHLNPAVWIYDVLLYIFMIAETGDNPVCSTGCHGQV